MSRYLPFFQLKTAFIQLKKTTTNGIKQKDLFAVSTF